MKKPEVTAVGRRVKSKHGELRKHQVIKIDADGKVKIVKDQVLR
jgi:hypothetical protein